MINHKDLLKVMKVLPTDYSPWGTVERWQDDNKAYPDCSCGCKYFVPLENNLGMDWGVCSKPDSPRSGLLTFEHQTGFECYEEDEEDEEEQ